MLKSRTTLISLTLLAAAALAACGGDNPENAAANAQTPAAPTPTPVPPASACAETGVDAKFACQTGATEPLYIYQWALRQATSYFKSFSGIADGVTDLNVEDVHAAGIKGQGVNVLVLDDGVDIGNEDLAANVNRLMTYNFDDGTNNPTPANIPENIKEAHGTHVAGIISAAQNGKGVIGIAPARPWAARVSSAPRMPISCRPTAVPTGPGTPTSSMRRTEAIPWCRTSTTPNPEAAPSSGPFQT